MVKDEINNYHNKLQTLSNYIYFPESKIKKYIVDSIMLLTNTYPKNYIYWCLANRRYVYAVPKCIPPYIC